MEFRLIKNLLIKCDSVVILQSPLEILYYKFYIKETREFHFIAENVMTAYFNNDHKLYLQELGYLMCLKTCIANANNFKIDIKNIKIRPMSKLECNFFNSSFKAPFETCQYVIVTSNNLHLLIESYDDDDIEYLNAYKKWLNFCAECDFEKEYISKAYFRHNFKYNNRNINQSLNREYILFNKNIKLDLNILVFKSIDPLTKQLIFNLYNSKINKYIIITTDTKILNKKNINRTDTFYFNHFSFNENDRILRLSCFIDLNTFSKYSETWYNFFKHMVKLINNFNNFYKDYSISFYRVIADLKFISKEYKNFCIEHTVDNYYKFRECILKTASKNFYIIKFLEEDTPLFCFIKLKRYNNTKSIDSFKYKIPFKPTIYFNDFEKKYCLIDDIMDSSIFKKDKPEYQLLLPKLPFKLESQAVYCKPFSFYPESFSEQYKTKGLKAIKFLEQNVKN
jgi:hypothetical protein